MKSDSTRHVRISEMSRLSGLSKDRLRILADAGKIPSHRSPGGHRLFPVTEVLRTLGLKARIVRVAVYHRYGVKGEERSKAVKLISSHDNLRPSWWVEETEKDLMRPLPLRQGFHQVLSLAADGQIVGVVAVDPRLFPSEARPWLGCMSRLGFYAWEIVDDTVSPVGFYVTGNYDVVPIERFVG